MNYLLRALDKFPRFAWFIFAILFAFAILLMGMRPAGVLPDTRLFLPHEDKLKHFIAFMMLGALLFRWKYPFDPRRKPIGEFPWLFVIAIPITIGAMDEFFQSFTEGRMSDPQDFIVDCYGAMTALTVGLYQRRNALRTIRKRRSIRLQIATASQQFHGDNAVPPSSFH